MEVGSDRRSSPTPGVNNLPISFLEDDVAADPRDEASESSDVPPLLPTSFSSHASLITTLFEEEDDEAPEPNPEVGRCKLARPRLESA